MNWHIILKILLLFAQGLCFFIAGGALADMENHGDWYTSAQEVDRERFTRALICGLVAVMFNLLI